MQAKIAWKYKLTTKSYVEFMAGVQNILNQKYSLGNDLNAVGGRYYNAAAPRNFYLGFNVKL